MDQAVHELFHWINWVVIAGYLGFTTWVGHRLRGTQGTIRDFFLGGRTLPWQAVAGSMIATEISALTFIGVPGTVFALQGDFTYLQWGIGSVIARFLVGYFLVPLYYEKEVYSPYDFMGNRLGKKIKTLVTGLFSAGAILGQSVRVLVTAIILKVVTGLPIEVCIIAIGLFAIAWTLMGGMRTVIWTDVVQFFLFVGGGLLALIWLIVGIDGGWKTITDTGQNAKVVSYAWKGEADKPAQQTIYRVEVDGVLKDQLVIEAGGDPKRPTLMGDFVGEGDEASVLISSQEIEGGVKLVQFDWNGESVTREIEPGLVGLPERIVLEKNPETEEPLLFGEFSLNDEGQLVVSVVERSIPARVETRNKMKWLDHRFWDENKKWLNFTIWIAIFAMPFQNFAAFGTDQLMAQRMFCCKSLGDARKAIIWSSASILITVLMLMVSVGLFTWYQQKAVSEAELALFTDDPNNIFPVWIVTVLPVGLSGLLIAGAFAAAISSLDSVLAALSQTTLSVIYGRERFESQQGSSNMVRISRITVVLWGIGLSIFAILLNVLYQMGEKNLIDLAFRMTAYTYGPMLGVLLLAILPVRSSVRGIVIGTVISIFIAAISLPDLYNVLKLVGIERFTKPDWIPFPFFYTINAIITFVCGMYWPKKADGGAEE